VRLACLVNLSLCDSISGTYLAYEKKGIKLVCRVRGVERSSCMCVYEGECGHIRGAEERVTIASEGESFQGQQE